MTWECFIFVRIILQTHKVIYHKQKTENSRNLKCDNGLRGMSLHSLTDKSVVGMLSCSWISTRFPQRLVTAESSMATRARALFTGKRQSQHPAVSLND